MADDATPSGRDISSSLSILPGSPSTHQNNQSDANDTNKGLLHQTPHRRRHRMTEKDAEEWIWNNALDLLYWKNPTFTLLWFLTGFLTFFLTIVVQFSFISIVCYVTILQLVFSWVLMRIAPVLAKAGILRGDFDPKVFALQRQAFSVDELRNASYGVALM